MSATYLFFSSPESDNSLWDICDAYLFWDGQALQLVTIDAATS